MFKLLKVTPTSERILLMTLREYSLEQACRETYKLIDTLCKPSLPFRIISNYSNSNANSNTSNRESEVKKKNLRNK